MRTPRIFTHQHLQPHSDIVLDADAANHVANVLRMQTGEHLFLFNGQGGHFAATLTHVKKKQVSVHIQECLLAQTESSLHITLGQSYRVANAWIMQFKKQLKWG